ncbi:MAG: alpha/beta fold hydrolase, partial [Deinococcales bacterium]
TPTGPYAIGTTTYHWADASRPELFTTAPHDHRELMAQLWYPAHKEPGGHAAPYLPNAPTTTRALARLMHLPPSTFAHLRYVTTHAVEDAPVAQAEQSYPVLIYLTGLGGFRDVAMCQIQELASHGYIVVGLDQPGAAGSVRFPDGREIRMPAVERIQALIDQSLDPTENPPSLGGRPLPDGILPYLAQDVSFTIDQLANLDADPTSSPLAGHVDLAHVGAFGFSLGAMVAAEAAHLDPRVKAVLMIDAAMPANVMKSGLQQPSMWMTRPASTMRLERSRSGGWTERDIAQTLNTMREVFERHRAGNAYFLQMPGMFHINYTDAPYYSPITRQLGLTGPVNGRHMHDVMNAYTLAFFDAYLKSRSAPLLKRPDKRHPEVEFEGR